MDDPNPQETVPKPSRKGARPPHSEDMDEPWAGDTDMRRTLMRERFGNPQALNHEHGKPKYRPRKAK